MKKILLVLLFGWGSTLGAINEGVSLAQAEGLKVSSLHLRFVNPLEPGLKDIFHNYKQVMTIEINYSDSKQNPQFTTDNRRFSQLSWVLRASTLVDIDCYSNVEGQPLSPNRILGVIKNQLSINQTQP